MSADEGNKELNCSLVYAECTAMRLTNKCPSRSLAILRFTLPAQVVKLVDTLASGASARKGVEVQVLSWAPNSKPIETTLCQCEFRASKTKRTVPAARPSVSKSDACGKSTNSLCRVLGQAHDSRPKDAADVRPIMLGQLPVAQARRHRPVPQGSLQNDRAQYHHLQRHR